MNQGKQIHELLIKSFYSANVFVGTSLVTMYAKCKVFDCLTQVFYAINNLSLATWNALIIGWICCERSDRVRSPGLQSNAISKHHFLDSSFYWVYQGQETEKCF
eukprot:TRINITY_DN9064_c0_g2_i4.p1 TRINITY_DN9064_c0_g2~~TRINITY_DN9064_c0_g2_i4.p1  ORF type:complete len:104 (-),score=7.49 TRINITY_DN9064_c0_g2_i4:131-442(-)